MTTALPPLSVLILAGGQGRRMAGRDKGLVRFGDRLFIEHALAVVRPLSDDLIISCNRNLARYGHFAKLLVQDAQPDFRGPLAGILAGMRQARHPALLVLPCDTPLLSDDLPRRLREAHARDPDAITAAHDGQRLQPLHAIYPVALAEALQAYLDGGGRSVMGWLDGQRLAPVDCSDRADAFANVNRPEELRALERLARDRNLS